MNRKFLEIMYRFHVALELAQALLGSSLPGPFPTTEECQKGKLLYLGVEGSANLSGPLCFLSHISTEEGEFYSNSK